MRLLLCLCILLWLSGCTTGTLPAFLVPQDQQLFAQGMDELAAGKEAPAAFAALQKNYPDSPWAENARSVEALLQTIHSQQQLIHSLQGDRRAYRKQDEILRQQKEALEEDLQRLKQLLIDLESRGQ